MLFLVPCCIVCDIRHVMYNYGRSTLQCFSNVHFTGQESSPRGNGWAIVLESANMGILLPSCRHAAASSTPSVLVGGIDMVLPLSTSPCDRHTPYHACKAFQPRKLTRRQHVCAGKDRPSGQAAISDISYLRRYISPPARWRKPCTSPKDHIGCGSKPYVASRCSKQ
jgi:hypothetical protein